MKKVSLGKKQKDEVEERGEISELRRWASCFRRLDPSPDAAQQASTSGRARWASPQAHHHPCPPACAKSMFPTNPTLAMALPLQDFKSLKKWFLDKHDLKLDEPFDDNSGLSHLHRAVLHVPKYQNEAREIIEKVRA